MAVVKRKPFAESFREGFFFFCLCVCKSACTNIFVDQSARLWKLLKSIATPSPRTTSRKVTPIFVHFFIAPPRYICQVRVRVIYSTYVRVCVICMQNIYTYIFIGDRQSDDWQTGICLHLLLMFILCGKYYLLCNTGKENTHKK